LGFGVWGFGVWGLGFGVCMTSPRIVAGHIFWFRKRKASPSSVRLDLGSSLLVLNQDIQYKLNVHLRRNAFNVKPNLTRTEQEDMPYE